MLSIAICDPNKIHRQTLADALTKLLFDAADCHFFFFPDGEKLMAAAKDAPGFQLLFLEIHLPGISGLEVAGQFRNIAPDTDIIFLTAAAEYVTAGYRYHAFDFLIKPVPMARLQEVVERYLEERTRRPADFLRISIQRSSVQLPLHQILYLESQRRKIIAHMWEGTREFYERLDHLEQLLDNSGFLRCHQSYLLNSDYIRRLNSTSVLLADQTELPVSRTYLQSLRTRLLLKKIPE